MSLLVRMGEKEISLYSVLPHPLIFTKKAMMLQNELHATFMQETVKNMRISIVKPDFPVSKEVAN